MSVIDNLNEDIQKLDAELDRVEAEKNQLQARIAELDKRIEEQDYIIKKFSEWYNQNDCPFSESGECMDIDDMMTDFKKEMASRDEDDRYPFDPYDDCQIDMQGRCYVEMYRRQYQTLTPKGDKPKCKTCGESGIKHWDTVTGKITLCPKCGKAVKNEFEK